jgi:hypothetical protein
LELIVHPNNAKQLDVIVKTATFFHDQDDSVIAHIKNKQAANPLFDFLWTSHPLHEFYRRIHEMITDGTLVYTPAAPTAEQAIPDDVADSTKAAKETPEDAVPIPQGTVTLASKDGLLLDFYSSESEDEQAVPPTVQSSAPVASSVTVSASANNIVSVSYDEEYHSDDASDHSDAPAFVDAHLMNTVEHLCASYLCFLLASFKLTLSGL